MEQVESGSKSAVRAGVGYTVGNILVKGIAFITIPLYSALMTTEEYGIYNTFAAYVSMLAVVVSLGLPSSVRNARFDFPGEEERYHANSVTLIAAAFALLLAAAAAFPRELSRGLGLAYPFVVLAVIDSACMALHSYYNNILMIDFQSRLFLKLSFFYSVTSIALSTLLIVTLFRGNAALARAIGNTAPLVLIAGFTLWQIWRKHAPRITGRYSVYGLRFGIPLIPSDLSSLILAQFDRIMILRTVGEAQAGIYSFAYNVAVIYQVITGSIDSAWTPWMFRMLHGGRHEALKKKIVYYVAGVTVFTALLLLVCPELITLMSGSAYWDSRRVVVPILLSMYFFAIASIPVGIGFYHKKTAWISGCTFGAALGNVALNLIFIPRFGYPAAAYTTLACYILYALAHILAAGRLENIRLLSMRAVRWLMALAVLVSLISTLALNHWKIRWGLAGAAAVGLLLVGIRHRETLAAAVKELRDTREAAEENSAT